MTPERWHQIKDVLATALEMLPAERTAYLDQSCAADASLRREVDLLLLDEEQLDPQFLNDAALANVAATILPEEDNPWIGRRVGAYKIVEQIGAGGMGEVYCAFLSTITEKQPPFANRSQATLGQIALSVPTLPAITTAWGRCCCGPVIPTNPWRRRRRDCKFFSSCLRLTRTMPPSASISGSPTLICSQR